MNNRRPLIFSIVCGFMAVILTWYYVSEQDKRFSEKYERIPILIATKDILRYQQIDESMLRPDLVPKPFVQPLAVPAKDRERLIGYVADATIKEGEQVTETKVARPGESRISITIPKNERACTVAVDEISGVGGLIRPGDHVDIIGTFKTVDAKSRVATDAETVTMFQNLPVLAVGKDYMFEGTPGIEQSKGILASSSKQTGGFSNVTMSATPRQCMDLTVAQQVGVITLSLRSYLNRFGGDTDVDLRQKRSTAATASGIQAPLEISRRPKWMEIRGEQTVFAP